MRVRSEDREQLKRLEPTIRWLDRFMAIGGEVIEVGPFRALLIPRAVSPGLNYVAPVDRSATDEEIAEALRKLRAVFAERGLPLRLEFNTPLFPHLAEMLEGQGFSLEEREPLMLCTPDEFTPISNPIVSVRYLRAQDDPTAVEAFQRIFTEVLLERSWQRDAEVIAALQAEIDRLGGRAHALAWLNGAPVGTGFITSADGVAEITRVATVPDARRRGVAATLCSFMIQDRVSHGDSLIWLTAANAGAQELYRRLGFRLVGDRLYYRAEERSSAQ